MLEGGFRWPNLRLKALDPIFLNSVVHERNLLASKRLSQELINLPYLPYPGFIWAKMGLLLRPLDWRLMFTEVTFLFGDLRPIW